METFRDNRKVKIKKNHKNYGEKSIGRRSQIEEASYGQL